MTEKKQKKQGKAMTRKTATGQADQKRDINSKSVLGNPILYAQFRSEERRVGKECRL